MKSQPVSLGTLLLSLGKQKSKDFGRWAMSFSQSAPFQERTFAVGFNCALFDW